VPLACLLVKYADKVNWVHDPASLAGQSIGRGRDERYSGRFLKVLITRRLRKKDGCLGRDVLEGRRGVTGQSGPRAGLGGGGRFPSVSSSSSQVSRCKLAAVAWFCAGAGPGAGAGLVQRKLPGLARGLRIGALLVLAVLCC
jgi:hypothetical protein